MNKFELIDNLQGKLVFDIGAYVGKVTRYLLRKGARVISIEPNEAIVAKSNYGKAQVEVKCIAAHSGPVNFYFNESSRSTCCAEMIGRDFECITRDGVTLDQLIAQHGRPYFIKIDVEGYEYEAFCGLSIPIPFLCFEFHRRLSVKNRLIIQYLAAKKYTTVWIFPRGKPKNCPLSGSLDLLNDYLFSYQCARWGDVIVR